MALDIHESLELAFKHFQAGNLKEAEKIYRTALKNQPDNIYALHFLGIICLQSGDYDTAIEYLNQEIRLNPDSADACNNLGIVFQAKRQFNKAITQFNKALRINPNLPLACYNLGLACQGANRLDEAALYYQKTLQMKPDYIEAHINLGGLLQTAGKLDEAIIHYQKALRINPNLPDILYNLGIIFQQRLQYDDAIKYLNEALQFLPDAYDIHAQLGLAFYNKIEIDEAFAYFQKSIELHPRYDEAYLYLGMICKEKGQYDDAIQHINKALLLNPKFAWAYTILGSILQAKGQLHEAKMYFQKALEINTDIGTSDKAPKYVIREPERLSHAISFNTENDHASILVVVNAFNRKRITKLSLAQTKRYKNPRCRIQVYNDHSTEYDNSFLLHYADEVIQLPEKTDIAHLRWHQLRTFLESDHDFLYLTDNDVIHDPQYIPALEALYGIGNGELPVTLYNGIFTMQPRMILDYGNGIMLKTTAPGCSMFYDRRMVEKIIAMSDKCDKTLDYLPWDNKAVAFLGLPWITPETSYLEHYGAGGISNTNYERDRAINPTEYLMARREAILNYLINEVDIQITF
jgi:tetratricopeptide (TPR) repeat protein